MKFTNFYLSLSIMHTHSSAGTDSFKSAFGINSFLFDYFWQSMIAYSLVELAHKLETTRGTTSPYVSSFSLISHQYCFLLLVMEIFHIARKCSLAE